MVFALGKTVKENSPEEVMLGLRSEGEVQGTKWGGGGGRMPANRGFEYS